MVKVTNVCAGMSKGERLSPCGQFIIDNNGDWKPNRSNPPSRAGARDPSDPMVSTRVTAKPAKFGRRATPVQSKKPLRPPKDSRFNEVL